jgi:catechol 2,3-dioxygenase-like lactoylglutathione lyase family enzyme
MTIRQIELLSPDLEAAREFYGEIFGLKEEIVPGEALSFNVGNSILSFKESPKGLNPFYHLAFQIPPNLFEDAYAWIDKRCEILPYSPSSVIADFTGWNAKAFYFHDNQQNILEFISHFDHNDSSELVFTPQVIKDVHEIGIVTDNVEEFCDELNRKSQIPYFHKGPRQKEFIVMGDSEGMLIVTRQNRGWLPTLRPAEKYPVELSLVHSGRLMNLSL